MTRQSRRLTKLLSPQFRQRTLVETNYAYSADMGRLKTRDLTSRD